LEGEHSTGANQSIERAQRGNRIGEKHQDEAAHNGIEWSIAQNFIHIALGEVHILQSGLGCASPSPRDGARIALYSHYFSRRANQTGRQHCDVSDTGTDIQNTLPQTNTCITKKSLRQWSESRCLSDQALVLGISAP
jgi:hypothetical protein